MFAPRALSKPYMNRLPSPSNLYIFSFVEVVLYPLRRLQWPSHPLSTSFPHLVPQLPSPSPLITLSKDPAPPLIPFSPHVNPHAHKQATYPMKTTAQNPHRTSLPNSRSRNNSCSNSIRSKWTGCRRRTVANWRSKLRAK